MKRVVPIHSEVVRAEERGRMRINGLGSQSALFVECGGVGGVVKSVVLLMILIW